MFTLRYLGFVLCSRDLDAQRVLRTMGFFTHKVRKSDDMDIGGKKCRITRTQGSSVRPTGFP